MTSWLHCRTRVGTATPGRSARLSERNVTRANWRAMSGSVRQKLLVSSSASSGWSGLPMITGAIWADQPRWLLSRASSRPDDVVAAEPADVAVVVDVPRVRADHHQRAEQLRRLLQRQDADHRADRVPDEDDVGELQLAADLDDVGGVAAQRGVLLRVVGREVGVAGADVVEEHDAVVDGEVRGDEPPHRLVAAEAVREQHRPARGDSPEAHAVPLDHAGHRTTLGDRRPLRPSRHPPASARARSVDPARGNAPKDFRSGPRVSANPCRVSSCAPTLPASRASSAVPQPGPTVRTRCAP